MEHLSVDKIIRFISFTEINENNLKLASEVNSHMIKCPECKKKVVSIRSTLDKLLSYSAPAYDTPLEAALDDDIQKQINDFYSF